MDRLGAYSLGFVKSWMIVASEGAWPLLMNLSHLKRDLREAFVREQTMKLTHSCIILTLGKNIPGVEHVRLGDEIEPWSEQDHSSLLSPYARSQLNLTQLSVRPCNTKMKYL